MFSEMSCIFIFQVWVLFHCFPTSSGDSLLSENLASRVRGSMALLWQVVLDPEMDVKTLYEDTLQSLRGLVLGARFGG
jgi:hypothetical protein